MSSVSWNDISDKPSTFTPSAHTHGFDDINFNNTGSNTQYLAGDGKFYTIRYNEIDNTPDLSNYLTNADLSNYVTNTELSDAIDGITVSSIGAAPTNHTHSALDINEGVLNIARIPTGTTSSTVALGNHTHSGYAASSHTHGTNNVTALTGYTEGSSTTTLSSSMSLNTALASLQNQVQAKAAASHTHTASQVSGLATVATSGSYNDLTNKPTIPTIPSLSVTNSGSGNVVTEITVSGHTITVTKGTISSTDTKNTTGTSNSTQKLYLVGGRSQSSTGVVTYSNNAVYTQSGQLYASQMNATNGFFETSDARLKDFKEDIKALDTVDRIPTKYFT